MRITSIDKPIYQENKNDSKIFELAKNNIELDLLNNIQQGYNEWLNAGNEGTIKYYLDTLSLEDLKLLSFKKGGIVDKANRPKEPVAVKDIDLTQEFLKTADFYSRLSSSEKETLDWMIKKLSGGK